MGSWVRKFASIAATAVLCGCLGACSPAPTGGRPVGTLEDIAALRERDDLNVMFILVDTLRADRLGAYGYDRETSPRIDALARSGIRFDSHLAQSSWTKCSMASLWTGLYPNRTGVLRAQHAVPDDAKLPAEIFRENGFRTAGIFRNGWVAANFGFGQGFEVYIQPLPHAKVRAEVASNPGWIAGSDDDVVRSASEFLRTHQEERWFLYLHLLDVHQYASDEASAVCGTGYSDIYDNAILWTDGLVGRLMDDLQTLGLSDRTLGVFASDHGEAFGEHGGEGHARDVYGEVTETPWMLFLPFRIDPGIVVTEASTNVDLWPTLLDLLGLPGLDEPDGRSLVPAIEAAAAGESRTPPEHMGFAQIDHAWGQLEATDQPTLVALTKDRWRLVYNGARPGHLELFDKQEDPTEQLNLARARPEVTQGLMANVEEYLDRSESPWGSSPMIEIDEMKLQQLRALGYGVQ